MRYEVKAEYSRTLVRKTAWRLMWKQFGWNSVFMWICMGGTLVLLVWLGGPGWLIGAFATMLILSSLVPVLVLELVDRRMRDWLGQMEAVVVQWVFDDEGIAASFDGVTTTYQWRAVERLWRFPEAWVIGVGEGGRSILPLTCLTDEIQQFIMEKLKDSVGKIS